MEIRMIDITKSFGEKTVIQKTSITINSGSFTTLLGPSGCGKITRLGITAVFVTHDQAEAMSMSDKIAVLSRGVVEQYDCPEVTYSAPKTEFVARFVGSSNWIDENRLFRPELDSLKPAADAVSFPVTVVSSQFLGNTYQVHLKYGEKDWSFLSPSKMCVGDTMALYISKNDIMQDTGITVIGSFGLVSVAPFTALCAGMMLAKPNVK